jgi:hypothetical protein
MIEISRETIYKIVICVLILLVVGLFLYYNVLPTYVNKIYQQGVVDGVVKTINQIQSTSSIPIVKTINNNQTIEWISLQQICGGVQ